MNHLNPREEIVFLLRGFFSNPVITALGKLGIINLIQKKKFKIENQKKIKNKKILKLVMNYTIRERKKIRKRMVQMARREV